MSYHLGYFVKEYPQNVTWRDKRNGTSKDIIQDNEDEVKRYSIDLMRFISEREKQRSKQYSKR